MPKFTKAITHAQKQKTLPFITTNYLSSSEALDPTVFEIFCLQGKTAQIYTEALLINYFSEYIQKLTRSSTYHYQSIHKCSGL